MKTYQKKSKKVIAFLSSLLFGTIFSLTAVGQSIQALAYEAPEPNAWGNYFTADYKSKEEAMAAADSLNQEICEEGFTLLKNDNSLPLQESAKISLFGKSSNEMLYGLSSNYVHLRGKMTTIQESLQDAGFKLNPTLVNFYQDVGQSGSGRGAQPTNGSFVNGFQTGETPVANYTQQVETSYEEYGDAAVVVFSRSSGEGWDAPRTMLWNGSSFTSNGRSQVVPGARSGEDHYLQLDQNESDLLKYVGERFENVVVVLNTPTTFETGFLDDPGHYGYHKNIKACLWVGYPGRTGLNAVGKILKGEVNPSGRAVDTWVRDFKADPTIQNFGDNGVASGHTYSGGGGTYVIYKEGIYVGYRYWETRGVTEGKETYVADGTANPVIHGTESREWQSWYDAHVVYPFGHGLSYTTFSQEIVDASIADNAVISETDTITVRVKVTNTGDVAGKETAMIFYTAPYYMGGIEKAHVVLGGFDKTKLLAPGESEVLTISMKVRDMASYDYSDANKNGFKGYELEAGQYEIKLMKDAHTLIDSLTYSVANDVKITTDDATGNPIVNQFDAVSNYLTDSKEEGGLGERYMSRSDFAGTFPTSAINIASTQALREKIREWTPGYQPADEGKEYYVPEDQAPVFGDDTGEIQLYDLFGAEYDDPMWEAFLNQLSESTMKYIVCQGGYRSGINLPKLGLTRAINAGQPAGYMSLFSGMEGAQYAFFSSDTVTAATFNEDLAYKKGIAIGNEALFGTGRAGSKFPGWYAPAADMHRSQFGGRNADYYSEDGLISGKMAAAIIRGAMEKGVFTFMKHFVLNEQEINRIGILTWANEQSMREIYFKPFELAVKEGGTRAIMSGLNRIGPTWSGGSYELLTNVLRKEWGFKGMVVTDSYIGSYSYLDQMLVAGGDISLGNSSSEASKLNNATKLTAMRNSVHNILYVMANSMSVNKTDAKPPKMINPYEGSNLSIASVDVAYIADIGTATINDIAFTAMGVTPPDDSEIQYTLKEGSSLPEGLTLSADGKITGTPVKETTLPCTFTVVASYGSETEEATFSISVSNINGSIIYQPQSNLPTATVGKDCNISVAMAEIYKYGATPEEIELFPEITYTLKNGSALPEGLTLQPTGEIVGVPTKECENYPFTVEASAVGFRAKEASFTLSIYRDLQFESKPLQEGKIGIGYLDCVNLAQMDGVTYALKEGSKLPAGLTLTKGGNITGTPLETVQDFTFTVVASADYCKPQEAEYTLCIGLSYNRIDLPMGQTGMEYYASLANAQGADEVLYTLKEGCELPQGLVLSADGILTGTPEKSGRYQITIVASAEGLLGDEKTFTLDIAEGEKEAQPFTVNWKFVQIAGAGFGLLVLVIVVTKVCKSKAKKIKKNKNKNK